MRFKVLSYAIGVLLITKSSIGQPSELELLRKIASFQSLDSTGTAIPGLFPSHFMEVGKGETLTKDNNIFYTALIAYTLRTLRDHMGQEETKIIDQVLENAERAFPYFKNPKRMTYNFWRYDSLFRFPYFENFILIDRDERIADDLDDTSMILLAKNNLEEAKEAHAIMQRYINKPGKSQIVAHSDYVDLPAYSTWYGKKMPVVFDVCVSSNILTFVNSYGLEWTAADSATWRFVQRVIKMKDYIRKPDEISFYYSNSAICIYHLARTLMTFPEDAFLQEKNQLKEDAFKLLKSEISFLERLILTNAILKLGDTCERLSITKEDLRQLNEPGTAFFIVNFYPYMSKVQTLIFELMNASNYEHHCSAYKYALLLEYLVLSRLNN